MSNRLIVLRIGLALVLFLAPARAETLTNLPSADTYFETYGSEAKNFGSAPILRMDQWGGRRVFLRFPLTRIPTTQRLLRATLRLYVVDIGDNEAGPLSDLKTCVGLHDVVTPWTETGLTYRTADGVQPWRQGPGIPGGKYSDVGPLPQPDIGVHLQRSAVPLDPAVVVEQSWLELDVTEFLRERIRAGEKEVNLLLRSSTLGRNYTFRSREAEELDQRPQLVVELSDGLPEMNLEDVWQTQWKSGDPVRLPVASPSAIRGTMRWSVTNALAAPEIQSSGTSATFVPAAPGFYRIRCEVSVPPAGEDDAQTAEWADVFALSVPPHPRLYVTSTTLPKLRQQMEGGGGLSAAYKRWVDAGSKGVPQGKYHDMGIKEGCEDNALMWLLTRERQYLSNSMAYAERMLSKRMSAHFHDVHDATFTGASWVHAMAVHYDWCFEELTAEHRRSVAEWLKEAARWSWVRSGAPIAHNDGGARQCLLGSAALALLGDDPDAPELYRRSRENFEHNLLPWLNDGGRGGRSGDGGEYEGLHAFYIVKFAWMSHTATGEDVFSLSPFFFNRIRHILFGWYPRRLVERNGAYSMRQYYSPSGDHIRMGYVGDTQPYQSAAALCARFKDAPEAQALRWLGGEWPTSWMQYCLKWAVLGDWENVPAREPAELAYFDPGCHTVFLRSDWSDDATWVLFENSPLVSAHGSLDSGTFEIFKGDLLAARTGNLDHANVGAKHTMNYLHRTIACNGLLIHDPAEKWKGFLGGAEGIDDGGGERTNWPLTTSPDAETYVTYRSVFQRGQVTRFLSEEGLTYAFADLTPAYTSPHFHNGKLNQPKVTSVTRQVLYVRGLDSVVVFDRVRSTKPEFKKTWLLHSLGDLEVLDGNETKQDDGEFHYRNATRAAIRHGWPKPVPSFGRCLSVTLLPENPQIVKIGGRLDLPPGETTGWSGDQWHGQHRHRHLKDFWVNGTNYPPGNPPESRWFGDPTSQWYVPGTPDETGGRGKWRLEVSPPAPAQDDVFFHVLSPRLGREGEFPTIERLSAAGYDGAWVAQQGLAAAVFFAHLEERLSSFAATLPVEPRCLLVVADLAPGRYDVACEGNAEAKHVEVGMNGILTLADMSGTVRVERR